MAEHVHEYITSLPDGLGWRCACGHLKDPPPADHVWTTSVPGVRECAKSPSGDHAFIHLKGAFAYCHFCNEGKRFLNG